MPKKSKKFLRKKKTMCLMRTQKLFRSSNDNYNKKSEKRKKKKDKTKLKSNKILTILADKVRTAVKNSSRPNFKNAITLEATKLFVNC